MLAQTLPDYQVHGQEMHLLHILVNSKNCRQIWILWDA